MRLAAATKNANPVWSVGVLTAPRPGQPVLGTTLDSLELAGWPDREIRVFNDRELSGCYRAWRVALAALLSASPQADLILLSEDDALFPAGLREFLESQHASGSLPSHSWLSLYCADSLDGMLDCQWQAVHTPRQCWGSVAYVIPPPLARSLLADPPMPNWRDGTDQAVGRFCQRAKVSYFVFSPSLVKHIGLISSLDDPGGEDINRTCCRWVNRIDRDDSESGRFTFDIHHRADAVRP